MDRIATERHWPATTRAQCRLSSAKLRRETGPCEGACVWRRPGGRRPDRAHCQPSPLSAVPAMVQTLVVCCLWFYARPSVLLALSDREMEIRDLPKWIQFSSMQSTIDCGRPLEIKTQKSGIATKYCTRRPLVWSPGSREGDEPSWDAAVCAVPWLRSAGSAPA